MRGIPNMTVFAPADEDDLLKMLPDVWNYPAPSYVRINTQKSGYEHTPFELGKAEVIAEGADVTILTYGLLFAQTLAAVEILKKEGVSVGLINMRSLKPADEQAILKAAKSKLVVTVEDHFLTGGLYSIVAETLLKHQTTAKVLPFALNDKWFKPSLLPNVLQHEGFTGKQIAEKILGYTTNAAQQTIALPQFSE
jgi:transketolase